MKYLVIFFTLLGILMIPAVAESFAEGSFNGYSSVDPLISEVVAGQSSVMNIRFWYTSGPYAMENFTPVLEVNPSSARQFVQVDVDSIGITQGQIKRIPVTLTVDPQIEHDKIFLSISYVGHHFQTDELQKSSWNDQVALDIVVQDSSVPEPEQDRLIPENCGPGTTLQDGICVVNNTKENTTDSSMRWGGPAHGTMSPLKQIKSGTALFDVKCREGKFPAYKDNRMRVACVSEETLDKLWTRGWATMRFTEEDISPHALCNNMKENGIQNTTDAGATFLICSVL